MAGYDFRTLSNDVAIDKNVNEIFYYADRRRDRHVHIHVHRSISYIYCLKYERNVCLRSTLNRA